MDSFSSAGDLLRFLLPDLAPAAAESGTIGTGWSALDAATGRWRRGELVLVEGGAATGKSALAFALALHAARGDHPVALVPLKHTVETAVGRLVAGMSGVALARVRRGAATPEERRALAAAADALAGLPLFVHTAADPALERLVAELRTLVVARGIRLVVVDGLASIQVAALDPAGGPADVRASIAATALATLVARLGVVGIATAAPGVRVAGDPAAQRRLRIRTGGDGAVEAVALHSAGREVAVLPARFDREHLRWHVG